MSRKHDDAASASEEEDTERTEIRKELSSLSFQELQQLKERMGAREYRRAFFGESTRLDPETPREFKRENKNRPREMSSKKPVSMFRDAEKHKKKEVRDPRFDPLCGEYDKKTFEENYKFIDDVRSNDIVALRTELKACEDPDRRQEIKFLIQRLTNQEREKLRNKKKKEERKLEWQRPALEPHLTKSEKRVKGLVEQYEELRQSGKLQKHIERRRKKVTQKARKRQLVPPT